MTLTKWLASSGPDKYGVGKAARPTSSAGQCKMAENDDDNYSRVMGSDRQKSQPNR